MTPSETPLMLRPAQGYQAEFCDPTTFPRAHNAGSAVPFKYVDPAKDDDHAPAVEGYLRAKRANHVNGDPHNRVRISMPLAAFVDAISDGNVTVHPSMQTVSFHKAPTTHNFGQDCVAQQFSVSLDQMRQWTAELVEKRPYLVSQGIVSVSEGIVSDDMATED